MGNSTSTNHAHLKSSSFLRSEHRPLKFHHVHSENIKIVHDGFTAKRVESFCKGICFSDRPVAIGEKVILQVAETSTNWSGFLRLGFTSIDPSTRIPRMLPKYACPDMTNIPGNWAKALPELYCHDKIVVCYSVLQNGDVNISVNGQDLPRPFISGVNINTNLWALIDIYGNATAVKFIAGGLTNLVRHNSVVSGQTTTVTNATHSAKIHESSPAKYHTRNAFVHLGYHPIVGRSIKLNGDKTVATRAPSEYSNGYVFSERPLRLNERVIIQILALDFSFNGGLTVGMTACDPGSLRSVVLPDDADVLLDRPEYWVVHKDIHTGGEPGDELSFTLTSEGEVHFGRNGHHVTVIMHVDKTIPMWLFLDLYGQFSQIKLLGVVGEAKSRKPSRPINSPSKPILTSAMSVSAGSSAGSLTVALPPSHGADAPPVPPRLGRSQSVGGAASPGASSTSYIKQETIQLPLFDVESDFVDSVTEETENVSNECSVCFEKACDSVIYTCGHACMCYECACNVKASSDALCPICRQEIKDVIRIFRT